VADWSSAWAAYEQQVLTLINTERAAGADCGTAGTFAPAAAVSMDPHLQCAARVHSLDMGTRDYFTHDSPDGPLGDTPWERIANSGYQGSATAENIGAGYGTPADVVAGWMGSDGHCANIMGAGSNQVGVGYASVSGSEWTNYWTLDFGWGN
jgi:uncharacterized protein YkwD